MKRTKPAVYMDSKDGMRMRVLAVVCPNCEHETSIKEVEVVDSPGSILVQWGAFRRQLRQALHEKGVRSNPGWSDQDVVDAFRQALGLSTDG